jgi:hypothetical protein
VACAWEKPMSSWNRKPAMVARDLLVSAPILDFFPMMLPAKGVTHVQLFLFQTQARAKEARAIHW